MNILHINAEMNWAGGEVQTLLLAKHSDSRTCRHLIACPPGSQLSLRAHKKGLTVFEIPMRSLNDGVAIWKLARLMTALRIDIVHMHTYLAHFLGSIAATIARVKCKIVTRRMNFTVERNLTNHWLYNCSTDKIVAVSQSVHRCLWDYIRDKEKIETIPDAIQIGPPPRLREQQAAVSAPILTIGTVCHLVERKGVTFLLHAAKKIINEFDHARFLIVGDGPLKSALEHQVMESGIADKVSFTGFQEDVRVELDKMDIFVLASLEEALGVAILEAMAAGLPVIATNVGGIPEVVRHGRNGMLVPSKDPDAIYQAIGLLLKNRPRMALYAAKGRIFVSRRHSVTSMVPRYNKCYHDLFEQELRRT